MKLLPNDVHPETGVTARAGKHGGVLWQHIELIKTLAGQGRNIDEIHALLPGDVPFDMLQNFVRNRRISTAPRPRPNSVRQHHRLLVALDGLCTIDELSGITGAYPSKLRAYCTTRNIPYKRERQGRKP